MSSSLDYYKANTQASELTSRTPFSPCVLSPAERPSLQR